LVFNQNNNQLYRLIDTVAETHLVPYLYFHQVYLSLNKTMPLSNVPVKNFIVLLIEVDITKLMLLENTVFFRTKLPTVYIL